jgi:hypothetical protein
MTDGFSDGRAPVYRRELPGGGYVAINVTREQEVIRTRVSVKQRAVDERDAGEPLVIAEVDGDERSESFAGMYRIAADNAAIARAILEKQRREAAG